MVPFDRFTVVLDACAIFPMLPRDVLLTLATHGFFSPKWSPQIRAEWTRNLAARLRERSTDVDPQKRVDRIAAAMDAAFPDANVGIGVVSLKIVWQGVGVRSLRGNRAAGGRRFDYLSAVRSLNPCPPPLKSPGASVSVDQEMG